MTNKEIETLLNVEGISGVYYDHAPKGTMLPFVTYTTGTVNFNADDRVYVKKKSLRVVLYSDRKNEQLEGRLEEAFNSAELPWNMSDDFAMNSEVFMSIYEMEVI